MPALDNDAFTYADGVLETVSAAKFTKLSTHNSLTVSSNAVTGTGADAMAVVTSWAGSTTAQYSEAVAGALDANGIGVMIFMDAVNTGYLYEIGDADSVFYKHVGGVITQLGSPATAGVPAHAYRCYMQTPGTLVGSDNGVDKITLPGETSIVSGKPGLFVYGGTPRLDTWVAGDFNEPTPPLAQIYPYDVVQKIG
jgi:hypothetical protein